MKRRTADWGQALWAGCFWLVALGPSLSPGLLLASKKENHVEYTDAMGSRLFLGGGGARGPVIYVIDMPKHSFELPTATRGLSSNVVMVPVRRWNDALTPWPAAGLYRGEQDFGGNAPATLRELVEQAIPAIEADAGLAPSARAICGYSLGGLFALYAFVHADVFVASACLSGSVWYEGWVDHLRGLDRRLDGHFAYLSVGTKEKRASRPILKGVQRNMEECADILRGCGCEVCYQTGPGNHMQHVDERFLAGLSAVDGFVARQ